MYQELTDPLQPIRTEHPCQTVTSHPGILNGKDSHISAAAGSERLIPHILLRGCGESVGRRLHRSRPLTSIIALFHFAHLMLL